MSRNWDYAELSKAAKSIGGPEKFVEMLENTSRRKGKLEMIPWLGVAAAGGFAINIIISGLVKHFKEVKKQNDEDIEVAKRGIISSIDDCDSDQKSEKSESFESDMNSNDTNIDYNSPKSF